MRSNSTLASPYKPSSRPSRRHTTTTQYYFEGACSLLDAEGEWCYDHGAKTVKVWLDGCADPNTVKLRTKRLDYLFEATTPTGNPSKIDLTLSNLALWGGTFAAIQSRVKLDHMLLAHPNANKFGLGASGTEAAAAETTLNNNKEQGTFQATNSTFEWSQATILFDRLGKDPFVSDCKFLRQGYSLGLSASLGDGGLSSGLVFQHNEIRLFNSFTGLTPGLVSTIAYNDISRGASDVDGAGVHIHIKSQNGALLYVSSKR